MKKFFAILTVLVTMFSVNVNADDIAKYKSMFTLNFIRYIGWPEEVKQGDFVIGVLKNKALAAELQLQTAGKKFGFQTIVVKEFNSIDEVTDCQMIYVSESINFSKSADIISQKVGKNTLIISENAGAISNGSMINFVVVNDLLKFEVSPSNAQSKGLSLSSNLVSMKNAIKM